MTETCRITVRIEDSSDHYHEEDWVKHIWPMMIPWFTRRHGVDKGRIELENGAVEIRWEYETEFEEDVAGEIL